MWTSPSFLSYLDFWMSLLHLVFKKLKGKRFALKLTHVCSLVIFQGRKGTNFITWTQSLLLLLEMWFLWIYIPFCSSFSFFLSAPFPIFCDSNPSPPPTIPPSPATTPPITSVLDPRRSSRSHHPLPHFRPYICTLPFSLCSFNSSSSHTRPLASTTTLETTFYHQTTSIPSWEEAMHKEFKALMVLRSDTKLGWFVGVGVNFTGTFSLVIKSTIIKCLISCCQEIVGSFLIGCEQWFSPWWLGKKVCMKLPLGLSVLAVLIWSSACPSVKVSQVVASFMLKGLFSLHELLLFLYSPDFFLHCFISQIRGWYHFDWW